MADSKDRPDVPVSHPDELEHRRQLAVRANSSLPRDGSKPATHPIRFKDYKEADLPDASLWENGLVYVSDLDQLKYSDGSVWKTVLDQATADESYHPKGAVEGRVNTSGSRTFQTSDVGKVVAMTGSSDATFTVPGNTFSADDVIYIEQQNTGQITIAGDGTATVRVWNTFNPKTGGRFAVAMLYFASANNPRLTGQLELA